MQPESAAFLWDVREAGSRITKFTEGLTGESYAADELRKSAVERQLEIIGEALNRLRKADPETAQRVPEISRIVGLRNILAHGYADLSGQPGLTAGSLRMWGATRDVVDIPTAVRGAALAGVHPFTLHRLVTQHGERAWRN